MKSVQHDVRGHFNRQVIQLYNIEVCKIPGAIVVRISRQLTDSCARQVANVMHRVWEHFYEIS